MPLSISIKNVPDAVVERIRERARANHRSVQGELLAILEEIFCPKKLSAQEVYRRTRASGLRTGAESAVMVRRVRDMR